MMSTRMRHPIPTTNRDEFGVAGSVRVRTRGIACCACAALFEDFEMSCEEGVQGWKADTDYADVDFDYGPVAGVDVDCDFVSRHFRVVADRD